MSQIIEAIYQNGVFQPLAPISANIHDGEKVMIEVSEKEFVESDENPIMKLAENFYEGLSAEDVAEIERVTLDRSNFFGEREK